MASGADRLSPELQGLFQAPEYRQAHWGCLVVDLQSGDALYEFQADKLFAPASTTKLFSVAAAWEGLGADSRFQTQIYRKGDLEPGGRLRGDLILVAGGDLSLGGRTLPDGRIAYMSHDHTYANDSLDGQLTETDPLAGLNELAQKVAAAGIQQVRGDVLIDTRLFDHTTSTGSGPTKVTPILVNDNLLDLTLAPTTTGQLAQLNIRPQTASLRVDSRVFTGAANESLVLEVQTLGPRNLLVSGRIPEGHRAIVKTFEVPDPASHARSLLIEALQRAGVVVERSIWADNAEARLPTRDEVAKLPKVASFSSPIFAEHAKLILKSSHNLSASTLPLLLAAKQNKRTLDEGLRIQRDFLAHAGIDTDTISFGGGAGGSPADAVTPRATVQLLKYMAGRPDRALFRSCLPVLGVDGTLADAVAANSPARGNVSAKTGTLIWNNHLNGKFLVNSKALAGYITTLKKRELGFAVFLNQTQIANEGEVLRLSQTLGRFCEILWTAH